MDDALQLFLVRTWIGSASARFQSLFSWMTPFGRPLELSLHLVGASGAVL